MRKIWIDLETAIHLGFCFCGNMDAQFDSLQTSLGSGAWDVLAFWVHGESVFQKDVYWEIPKHVVLENIVCIVCLIFLCVCFLTFPVKIVNTVLV